MTRGVQQREYATKNAITRAECALYGRRRISTVALFVSAVLAISIDPLAAQVNDSRDDGNEAFHDALLGTPNRYTPQPPTNLFATAPGLEQQAPRPQFTYNALLPILFNSNPLALRSGGVDSAEFSPLAGISWTTPVGDLPLRFTVNARAEVDRFTGETSANFDKIAASFRLQYIDLNNDQAYSPYFVYAPRWDFTPTFDREFSRRQDLNLGFNKVFNFDASFQRVAFSSSSSADTAWSFGLTAFVQRRFREPLESSWGAFVIPSVSYVISPQWNVTAGIEVLRRVFDSNNGFRQRDWFIEPLATLEFVMPGSWFGGDSSATMLGRPALDVMAAYEENWSNFEPASYRIWRTGVVLKLGWST